MTPDCAILSIPELMAARMRLLRQRERECRQVGSPGSRAMVTTLDQQIAAIDRELRIRGRGR